MKFTILKDKLEAALNTVGKAITGKSAKPILNGVKLEMNQNGLYLTASDTMINIITKIPVEDKNHKTLISVIDEGVVLINARSLTDIVRKFDGETLEVELIEENLLKIKDNISDFSLNCMDVEEYPMIDVNSNGVKFNLKSKDFSVGVSQTSYAASDRDTRPILQGVNVAGHGNTLEFVATDSFRIARKIINIEQEADFSVTIPAKTLADVAKICESDENVAITVSEKRVAFKLENTLVIVGVINGTFPEISRLVPSSFESTLITDPIKLAASIDRTSTLSSDRGCVVRFSMDQDNFKVISRSQEVGSGNDTVQAFDYSGERLDISFTSRYILDALKSLSGGDVNFKFNGDAKPVVITSSTDSSVLALVLPVRTY